MGDIEAAIASLESLKLGEKPNYAKVARKYNVDQSMLSRRHRGVQASQEERTKNQQLLTKTQEKELLNYINKLCKRGLPPTKQIIHNFASEIARKQVGKS